jgi:hypothetical protein
MWAKLLNEYRGNVISCHFVWIIKQETLVAFLTYYYINPMAIQTEKVINFSLADENDVFM